MEYRFANIDSVKIKGVPNAKGVIVFNTKKVDLERNILNKESEDPIKAKILEECPNFSQFASPAFIVTTHVG